jgi:hypothetical protein
MAREMIRNLLNACLLIGLLSPALLSAKPLGRVPRNLFVHTYTFTSSEFPAALLPLKDLYEKEKGPRATGFQGWQGVGKKAELVEILRQFSVAAGPRLSEETSSYPVEPPAEASARWEKVQADLADLVSHPAIAKPYFGLVLSEGQLPGTILHQLATGYPVWVGGQQSYLSLVYSATLRPGGFVCHVFQQNDNPRSSSRYYGMIVSCDNTAK